MSSGPLSQYGINLGPMALSWAFRFVNGKLEAYTGKALSRSYQKQKKTSREHETSEERAARKAARKAAKRAAKEEAERIRQEQHRVELDRRKEAASTAGAKLFSTNTPETDTHLEESRKEFKQQVETSDFDDLD